MPTLQSLEQKFHFTYPEIYKKLFSDNMLDWGQSGPNWYTTEFPKLKRQPPLLLFGCDIELMALEEIEAELDALADPEDYRQMLPELKFVPFARSGAGDLYCFYYNEKPGDDIPIVFMWHDMNEVNIKAKNLQDFIFRNMLEAVTDMDDNLLIMDGSLQENCKNVLQTHLPFLNESQRKVLTEIYSREFFEYTYKLPIGRDAKANGLLTYSEQEELLKAEIGFEHLDKKFPYQRN